MAQRRYLDLTGLTNLVTNIRAWVASIVPTKTSELNNDANFITSSDLPTNHVTTNTTQTLTATKTIQNAEINLKQTGITLGTTPSSNQYKRVQSVDNSGTAFAQLVYVQRNDGNTYIELRAGDKFTSGTKATNGTQIWSDFQVGTSPDGNKYIYTDARWSSSLIPYTNNALSLGDATHRWTNIYGTIRLDPANNATADLLYSKVGSNDYFRLQVGGASNAGWVELATADDGDEPIYVRQYTGVFTTLKRTLTLLDGSGNTTLPGTLNAVSYQLNGTAFGDIVTHNASEFLTSHQSLGNYVTLNSAQTITGAKYFGSSLIKIKTSSQQKGVIPTGNQHNYIEFLDKDNFQTGFISKYKSGGYSCVQINSSDLYKNQAMATDGTAVSATFTIGTSTKGVAYWQAPMGSWESIYPHTERTSITLGTSSNQWAVAYVKAYHAYDQNAFTAKNGNYTFLIRNDGNATYFLMSESGGNEGTWSSARPLTITNSTGVCNINGNAATATTAGNVTGTVAIANGGTGATTRLGAVQALTNENVGTATNYFLTITSNWGKAGYASVNDIHHVLGLIGKHGSISKGTNPSSQTWVRSYIRYDKNGTAVANRITEHRACVNTDGSVDTENISWCFASGSSATAILGVKCKLDGSGYAYCPNPPASDNTNSIATTKWVNDKGYLTSHQSLANYATLNGAQTITGAKTFTGGVTLSSTAKMTVNHATVVKGTNPSSVQYWQIFNCDKNGANWGTNTLSIIEGALDANGKSSIYFRACKNEANSTASGTLAVVYDSANNKTWAECPTPDANSNDTKIATTKWVNDKGYLTSHQSLSNYVTLDGVQTISGGKKFTGSIIGINKDSSTENANDLYSTTSGSKLTYYTTTNGATTLTNVPAAVNTILESRTIRRLSASDWVVEQICHNNNGLYYRKGNNGTWSAWKTFAFTDSSITGNAATATQFSANKSVTLTGDVTGTASSKAGWSIATHVNPEICLPTVGVSDSYDIDTTNWSVSGADIHVTVKDANNLTVPGYVMIYLSKCAATDYVIIQLTAMARSAGVYVPAIKSGGNYYVKACFPTNGDCYINIVKTAGTIGYAKLYPFVGNFGYVHPS